MQIYRYRNEYFLPPRDQEWINQDERFDYDHKPNEDDYKRGRGRP